MSDKRATAYRQEILKLVTEYKKLSFTVLAALIWDQFVEEGINVTPNFLVRPVWELIFEKQLIYDGVYLCIA